jgi:hypothetical protein
MSGYNGYIVSALVLVIALIYIRDIYSTSIGEQNTKGANANNRGSLVDAKGEKLAFTEGHLYIQYCAS